MKPSKIACALLVSTFVPAMFLAISVASIQIASSAETAPKGNKGFTASKTTAVDLGPEIDGMAGRELRLRVLTIEPGGYIGLHSHQDRPAVVYVMQGADEVGLADGSTKIMHAGDTSTATKNTTHCHRNIGNDNVVLIAVDVFHAAK